MKHFIEIHLADSSPQRHELASGRSTLGTGPLSSIRIPESSGLADEQVELFVNERGVRIQTSLGTASVLVFDGADCREAHVPWGGEAFLKNVCLTFLEESTARRSGSVFLLALPVVITMLGVGAYKAATPEDVSTQDVSAPPLFDEKRVLACAETTPLSAAHRALKAEQGALAKQERSAFDATDGVDALALLREAQACFRAANQLEDASRVTAALAHWSDRLTARFAALRIRLRGALDGGRPGDALVVIRELQAMFAHHDQGPYQRWLAQLGRTLERQAAQSGM